MKKYILGTLLALALALSIFVVNLIWFRPFSLDLFYERAFIEFGIKNPQIMSSLGFPGTGYFNDKLNDYSEAFQDEMLALAEKDLALLLQYDVDAMSEEQKRSRDILIWYFEDIIEGEKFRHHGYSVTQQGGVQQGLTLFMIGIHRVEDESDLLDYLARLSQFTRVFAEVKESLLIEQQLGVIPPTFIIDKILDGMKAIAATPIEENALYVDFMDKLGGVEGLPQDNKDRLKDRLITTLNDQVLPAYRDYIAYFTELRGKSTNEAGAWKLPDGDAYYQFRIRAQTTTDYSAEELHAIGLAEVDRIETEMLKILSDLGMEEMSVSQAMRKFGDDEQYLYADTREGRDQILEDYKTIIGEINSGLDAAFKRHPKAGVEVRAVPEFREKTAAGGSYQRPSMDGSRPGIFYANLYDIKATQKYAMRTLAYHEAVPGHHFQIAIAQELEGLPTFRGIIGFTSYIEGWALYAERLAWELGYQDNPMDNLGRVQAEIFRAVRLVVDTGIHQKRWTRERAIDYMRDKTGMAESEVVSEIERYIVNPAQALAYKVGMLKILEVREKAKSELGDAFDLRDFHDVILAHGPVPMTMLEQMVDEYIDSSAILK